MTGELDVSLLEVGEGVLFEPALGDSFWVLSFEDRGGTAFDRVTGSVLSTSLALAPVWGVHDLTLVARVPGDVNMDDAVSVADLSKFALNFGEVVGVGRWDLGDFNGDGVVTVADLSLLALNFGFDAGSGEAASGLSLVAAARLAGIDVSLVPEPGVLGVWVGLGGVLVGWRCGREGGCR